MRALAFSLRALRREWRAGELRVLALAVVVAVAAVSAVGFFTDRIRLAMAHQAAELLAADLVVASGKGIAPAWEVEAKRLGLRQTATVDFRSMVVSGERLQLAEVKAVGTGYPLRGTMEVAKRPFGPVTIATGGPAPGTAWADPHLFQVLGLKPGARVELGRRSLEVTRVIGLEPDRGGSLFSIAPRLMINRADLAGTGLIQTGSLVSYRLLLAGSDVALQRFERWVKPRLGRGERLLSVRDARPELRLALDRAHRFLGLAALVSVLLAGVAAATAARRYTRRSLDGAALMRCFGASQSFILGSFGVRLVALGLIASFWGVAIGYVAQGGLSVLLGDLFAQRLPVPSALPAVQGVATGLVALAGFALPPLLALRDVPPLRVLRRDLAPVVPRGLLVYGTAVASLLLLTAWQAGEPRLTGYVFAGTTATLLLLSVVSKLLVAALAPLRRTVGVAWRFGLANITRRPGSSTVQVVAFGIGLMALLLLGLVRGDLLAGWQERLPPHAPNRFLIDIQPKQVTAVQKFLEVRGLTAPAFYPMVKGRLVSIGGREVSAADYSDRRAKHLVTREFNLSWAAHIAADNRVAAGRFWGAGTRGERQWSVEKGLAETLGIKLGDMLRFRIGTEVVAGPVTSLRSVDWDSFHANFFVLAPPGVLDRFPASYITSFYLPQQRGTVLADLVRRFPNVTVIDVEAIMARVRAIIDRVSLAVEFVFAFTVAAGLMVLLAAIQATHDERLREAAMLRVLGAGRGRVLAGIAAEFVVLGLLAGALAALASTAVGYVLAERVFELAFHFDPRVWVWGIVGGGAGIGLAGVLGTRSVLDQPPLRVLQR